MLVLFPLSMPKIVYQSTAFAVRKSKPSNIPIVYQNMEIHKYICELKVFLTFLKKKTK